MAEMVVFAVVLGVVLVVSNVVTAMFTMSLFTNPKFVKSYMLRLIDACNEINKEVQDIQKGE